jgi:hypothetical protein
VAEKEPRTTETERTGFTAIPTGAKGKNHAAVLLLLDNGRVAQRVNNNKWRCSSLFWNDDEAPLTFYHKSEANSIVCGLCRLLEC